MAGAYF